MTQIESRDEKSLLIFFEQMAVDYGGLLQNSKLNADDFRIAEKWRDDGFIKFGRIKLDDVPKATGCGSSPRAYWVVLSDEAWELAAKERRARFERIESKLTVERIGVTE